MVALSVVVAGCGTSSGGPNASHGATRMKRYRDPHLGWVLAYPSALHLEHSQSPSFIRIFVDEVTVANFSMPSPIHASESESGSSMRVGPPRTRHGVFPSDGIAVRIYRLEGGPGPDLESPESHFPLQLSSLHRSTDYGNNPPALERSVVADGGNYSIQAWIGANASAGERAILRRVVASLVFPRLHVGETAGGFQVFVQASQYPVGSFTRIDVQGQPYYLVHAPGGWYAVGWKWQSITGGYKSGCRLQFDRATKQFFCTNIHARWDRVGHVIVKPRSAREGDPLNLTIAKVAWDGHVLVTGDVARFADNSYARQLWPSTFGR